MRRYLHRNKKYTAILCAIMLIILAALALLLRLELQQKNRTIIYGVAVGGALPYMNNKDITNELEHIKSTGFTAIRFDVPWNLVQPKNQSSYDWSKFDTIFRLTKKIGLEPFPIIDSTPAWARPSDCKFSTVCAPAQPSQFAQYAAAVVKRYSSQGAKDWEIWNEPNTVTFWKPAPNPAVYTQLLKKTYQSIKHVDPSATVLSGGLAGSTGNGDIYHIDPRTFLSELYKDGARNYFDGVAYHPYTNLYLPNDQQPNNGWSKMASLNPSIRSIMIANGDSNKKIWITEMGISTGGPGSEATSSGSLPPHAGYVSEHLQAQAAQQALDDVKKQNWIGSFFWYSYQDAGLSNTASENFYGLVKYDGARKPVYKTFYNFLRH